jgi:AbrB family looped-hinge helix DNA binding protein
METMTLSPKFQVVIPRPIREAMGLKPGMPIQVLQYGDRIELIPARPMAAARGLCRGMDTTVLRDEDR